MPCVNATAAECDEREIARRTTAASALLLDQASGANTLSCGVALNERSVCAHLTIVASATAARAKHGFIVKQDETPARALP
jgi:hypothetical protein